MSRIFIISLLACLQFAGAGGFYERNPVDYENSKEDNEISRLQSKVDAGLELEYNENHGYLPGVLKALNIPVSSQTLVFSKTSLHRKVISPDEPRALYFNENTYIGWVKDARVLEIGVADKNLGAVFYTLDQKKSAKPQFERDDTCLSCHASGRTGNEPGFFIRSVVPDEDGEPISRAGEDRVNHKTPLEDRWGGWFVTAEKLSVGHRGNAVAKDDGVYKIESKPAKTLNDLSEFFDASHYLTDTSDIEALLALEHQVEMHNILVQTKFRSMHALHNEKVVNEALGETGRRDLTKRILHKAADEIIDYMLFVEEESLGKVDLKGHGKFTKDFAKGKAKSSDGKSFYDFDFDKRILSLPCSWTVYSDAFEGLPIELKKLVLQRLKNILQSSELPDKFIHLRKSKDEIHKILTETLEAYHKA